MGATVGAVVGAVVGAGVVVASGVAVAAGGAVGAAVAAVAAGVFVGAAAVGTLMRTVANGDIDIAALALGEAASHCREREVERRPGRASGAAATRRSA